MNENGSSSMKRSGMLYIFVGVATVAVIAWFAKNAIAKASYPIASTMPTSTSEPLSDVLRRLNESIATHAPNIFSALRPGLTTEEIKSIESQYQIKLTDDLREVYRWHDGISPESGKTLFELYQFHPLEQLAKSRVAQAEQLANATLVQRIFYSVLCGHRREWIEFLPDGCGDGYFVDPTRTDAQGAVFYNFNEDHHYRFYPSLSNLFVAVLECYDAGLYSDETKQVPPLATIEKELAIHAKYGANQ